jgi:hypothetical protein
LSTITVFLGDGDDALYVGGGNVAPIQGWLRVDGGNGAADALVMVDNGTAGSDNYMLNSTEIGRGSVARATCTTFEEVYLLAERGNNTINVSGTMIGCSYYVNGYDGSDTYNIQETNSAAPVVIDRSNGDDTVNVNTDNTGTDKLVFPYSERIGALGVANGGVAQLAPADPGDDHVLTVTSASFGTGQLDLTNGSLIVDYTGPTALPSVRDALTSGYFAGGWTGAGIVSSLAAADAQHSTALGYAEAAQLGAWSFDGATVDSTAIVVKYTHYGDANLDGNVDTIDFNLLAANFGGSNKQWLQGDFNVDTTTNTIDFNLLAANFGKNVAPAAPRIAAPPAPAGSTAKGESANTLSARRTSWTDDLFGQVRIDQPT